MILVDASVVIAYLRSGDPRLLHLFQTHSAAICGATRAEILFGARTPTERARLVGAMSVFNYVPFAEYLWDEVGDNLSALRGRGLTLPLVDVLVATLAVHANLEVWARDQHFRQLQQVLPALRLFQEPP